MDLKVLEDQLEIQDCLVFLEKMEIEDSLEKEVHQVKMDPLVQLGSQESSDPLVLLEKVVHLVKLVLLDPKDPRDLFLPNQDLLELKMVLCLVLQVLQYLQQDPHWVKMVPL